MKYFRVMAALLALFALAGCGRGKPGVYGMTDQTASVDAAERYADPAKAQGASPYMAYEHSVSLQTTEDRVRPVYEAALTACRDAAAAPCTVLKSGLETGDGASATLQFRARPEGIKKILAALAEQGGVVSQSTEAEDLAGPISDASKKLQMALDYRTRLEALRGRASASIESLIKVNKELAQVQGEIEALTGEKARLMQRVETEILNVRISSSRERPFWRPIGRAFSSFGANLADAFGTAITAVAYLIPALPIVFGLAWLTRKLWQRLRRKA